MYPGENRSGAAPGVPHACHADQQISVGEEWPFLREKAEFPASDRSSGSRLSCDETLEFVLVVKAVSLLEEGIDLLLRGPGKILALSLLLMGRCDTILCN